MRKHLEYPDCSLYDFLKQNAKNYESSCALEYFGMKITYRRLLEEIHRCAKALRHMGIQNGDTVSICLPNIPQAVVAFYAVNSIGAVANMIHPLSAQAEILHYLTVSQSRMIIALDMTAEKIQKVLPQTNVAHTVYVSVSEEMPLYLKLAYHLTNRKKLFFPVMLWYGKIFLHLMARRSSLPNTTEQARNVLLFCTAAVQRESLRGLCFRILISMRLHFRASKAAAVCAKAIGFSPSCQYFTDSDWVCAFILY